MRLADRVAIVTGAGRGIGRYQALGIWPHDPLIPRADIEHYQDILLSVGWMARRVPYEDQVDTSFAEQAIAALATS